MRENSVQQTGFNEFLNQRVFIAIFNNWKRLVWVLIKSVSKSLVSNHLQSHLKDLCWSDFSWTLLQVWSSQLLFQMQAPQFLCHRNLGWNRTRYFVAEDTCTLECHFENLGLQFLSGTLFLIVRQPRKLRPECDCQR